MKTLATFVTDARADPPRPDQVWNDISASTSSSKTSKTVMSWVICRMSFTLGGRLSNFSAPPRFFTVVKVATSSPIPEESIVVAPWRSIKMLLAPDRTPSVWHHFAPDVVSSR